MRGIRLVAVVAVLAGLFAGCGGSSGSSPAPAPVKSWGTPVLLQQDDSTGSTHDPAIPLRLGPVVRFDAPGKAMVAWPQQGAAWDIVAVRYDGAWGAESALDNASENAFRPMFAWDGTGAGHLVWYEWDGAQYNFWTRRFLPGIGWEGTFTPIALDCGDTPEHSVEADRYGNVFLLWNQIDPADVNVRNVIVSRFDNTAGEWNTPLAGMDDTSPPNAGDGKIAVSPSGVAFAAWIRFEALSDGSVKRTVHARRYEPSAGEWETPEMISADNVVAHEVEVAADGSGNAIVAWAQQENGNSHIWARRFGAGRGWGGPEPVETENTARSGSFRLRMNASGNAVAAWRHNDGVSNHIWANLFDPSRGWGVAGPIEPDTAGDSSATPAAAIDPGGNAVVLWRQTDGLWNSLFANRYAVGGGWGEPVPIESEAGDVAPELGLDVDPDGNAIAVWLQDDGTVTGGARFTVRASVFR